MTWKQFERRPDFEGHEVWINNRYQVLKRLAGSGDAGEMWHLSIKRLDRKPVRDWRDMQRIKNELVGPEAEAVELYPAESRLVDTSNQYHLWVFPSFQFPFGYGTRLVSETEAFGNKQRPFVERPADLADEAALLEQAKKAGFA